jgi:hypothetical protein
MLSVDVPLVDLDDKDFVDDVSDLSDPVHCDEEEDDRCTLAAKDSRCGSERYKR